MCVTYVRKIILFAINGHQLTKTVCFFTIEVAQQKEFTTSEIGANNSSSVIADNDQS